MYADVVLMRKNEYVEKLARHLGFGRVFFLEDFKNLKIEKGKDINYNRRLIESRKINVLLNPQDYEKEDSIKQRKIGVNHILLKLANKNKVLIGLSLDQFSDVMKLGRIIELIKLCRKYKVKIAVFSLAKTRYGLSGANDIISLLKICGMTPGDAKKALEYILRVE